MTNRKATCVPTANAILTNVTSSLCVKVTVSVASRVRERLCTQFYATCKKNHNHDQIKL